MNTSGMSPLGLQTVQGSGECSISEGDKRQLGEGGPSPSLTLRYIIPCPPSLLSPAQHSPAQPRQDVLLQKGLLR